MEVGPYLVAYAQSLQLLEPGGGPLDDPAGLARSGAWTVPLRAIFGEKDLVQLRPDAGFAARSSAGSRPAYRCRLAAVEATAAPRVLTGHQAEDQRTGSESC